jgi:heme/copper-type cytochrome/quinol oxidase subunit 2
MASSVLGFGNYQSKSLVIAMAVAIVTIAAVAVTVSITAVVAYCCHQFKKSQATQATRATFHECYKVDIGLPEVRSRAMVGTPVCR